MNFVISLPDKLLIISGQVRDSPKGLPNLDEGKHVEIINSDFSPSRCKEKKLDFLPRIKAFGGKIGENNIICGGRSDETIYDTCFSISNPGEIFSTMKVTAILVVKFSSGVYKIGKIFA